MFVGPPVLVTKNIFLVILGAQGAPLGAEGHLLEPQRCPKIRKKPQNGRGLKQKPLPLEAQGAQDAISGEKFEEMPCFLTVF